MAFNDRDFEKVKGMLSGVLQKEAKALSGIVNYLDESYVRAVDWIKNCPSKVVCTGMGKSGYVAHKTAATLSSTGTLAVYLHPTEALHGDLGLVTAQDIILIFGKSGESEEITALLPGLKRLGAKIIAVTGNKDSTLGRNSDLILWCPVEREACPYDLAPTSSAVVSMAIGDALALTVMELKGFKPDDFALYHPGGRLGKRLLLTVGDLMIPLSKCKTLDPDKAKMNDVISSLSPLGLVLFVKNKSELSGILTDGDLRRTLDQHKKDTFDLDLNKLINKKPFSVDKSELAYKALELMEKRERPLNVVPVLDGRELVGILRLHELLHVF